MTTTSVAQRDANQKAAYRIAALLLGVGTQAQGSNRTFYSHYRTAHGANGHFDIPLSGDHGWSIGGGSRRGRRCATCEVGGAIAAAPC